MPIRDRIKELRRVRASDLAAHPNNWRIHPAGQRAAMRQLLTDIGYADALLVRECAGGRLAIIDGHLRADLTPEMEVPVLVLDVTEAEADKILASFDPVAAMAETDRQQLGKVLEAIAADDAAFCRKLADLLPAVDPPIQHAAVPEIEIKPSYQVVVECDGEDEQRAIYEQMRREGHRCRLLML